MPPSQEADLCLLPLTRSILLEHLPRGRRRIGSADQPCMRYGLCPKSETDIISACFQDAMLGTVSLYSAAL